MLPQLLASQLTNNVKKPNNDPVRLIYDGCDIVLCLVKDFNIEHLAMLKWNILKNVSQQSVMLLTKKPVLYLELFETTTNPDSTRHLGGIMDDLGKIGYDIHINIVSEFDPDLSDLLLCDYVSKITWDRSAYVSFVNLKNTAQKKQEGKLSSYGNYFIPKVVESIKEVFTVDLSSVDNFEDLYSGAGILEILNDNIKVKSVIMQ